MTAVAYLPSDLSDRLVANPRRWLVTGAAGFIGSNLVEALVRAGQEVVGLDNYSTGYAANVEAALAATPDARFTMIEDDIRNRDAVARAVSGVDVVLHQAALGSVPRSIADPLASHDSNVTGFLNMLDAARVAGSRGSSTPLPRRHTATIPRYRRSRSRSAIRCRLMPSPSWSMNFTRPSMRAATVSGRPACGTSMSSGRARIPTAPMRPSFPSGSRP